MNRSICSGLAVVAGCLIAQTALAQEAVLPHQTFTIESAAVHETRRVNVYTPPGYDAAPGTRFDVLYMPDGGVDEDFPHVVATADSAIRAGEMRPVIVVGIVNTERRRDMTGPTSVARDSAIAPRVGGSAAFRRFIATELIPEVGRRYRVSEHRAIIGESLAGLFIVETFFEQPELFDTYIALDPSLWWNGEALVRSAGDRLGERRDLRAAFFFSSSDEEGIALPSGRLARTLRDLAPLGVHWEYTPLTNLTHGTIYRAEAPRMLRVALPPQPAHPRAR